MRDIVLLPLGEKDCEAVFGIARDSLPEHWSLDSIRSVLQYENNIYYVARHTGQNRVVGFAGIMVIADEAELLNIAVDSKYRSHGIGKMLMEQVLIEAERAGAGRLLLEVRESNLPAIHLYRSYGFQDMGRRRAYYSNPVEDALIMERRFAGA